MDRVKMRIDDFLIKQIGVFMICLGILGIGFDIFYDRIIGNSSNDYVFGAVQWLFLIVCFGMIYVGWAFNRLMEVFKEDNKKEDV